VFLVDDWAVRFVLRRLAGHLSCGGWRAICPAAAGGPFVLRRLAGQLRTPGEA
jgi:hypothetical protein